MCVNSTIINVLWFNKILLITSIIKLALIHECISPKSYIEIMQRKILKNMTRWKSIFSKNSKTIETHTICGSVRFEYLENINFWGPHTILKFFSLFLCICTALYIGDFLVCQLEYMFFEPYFSFEDHLSLAPLLRGIDIRSSHFCRRWEREYK